jgi:hypothetical protein
MHVDQKQEIIRLNKKFVLKSSFPITIADVRKRPTRELLKLAHEKTPGSRSWYHGQSESSARSFAKTI